MERYKLDLIKEGKLSNVSFADEDSGSAGVHPRFDTLNNLCLLPKFNEKDPDTFFSLFEWLADSCDWPDNERTSMLQCVFTGRAQEAYLTLSPEESKSYDKVKSIVLKDLESHFSRWCTASGVNNFEDLFHLIVLEQFKNSLPSFVATYINEHKVKVSSEAAVLADEFVLTHKNSEQFNSEVECGASSQISNKAITSTYSKVDHIGKYDPKKNCNYCKRNGHWKSDCPNLKSKTKSDAVLIKLDACASLITAVDPLVSKVPVKVQSKNSELQDSSGYSAFMSDGFVSLVGGSRVPVKILRDTGAVDTFVCESVLPFFASIPYR
ncbi:hypothetical protein LDENG_00222510 [Lucifuga dentata]|nr:hypothetical protein LDENG_00222510 [Lucifuga dentata]